MWPMQQQAVGSSLRPLHTALIPTHSSRCAEFSNLLTSRSSSSSSSKTINQTPRAQIQRLPSGPCSQLLQRQQQQPLQQPSVSRSSRTLAATAAPASTAAGLADPCLDLQGLQARAVGALLGSMCGNALGAQLEPEKHYRIARLFPEGPHDMAWSFDICSNPLPPGHVTGDFITMLAVGWSLARKGQADAFDMLDCLASCYSPGSAARYSPYTELALEGLAAGTNPFMLANHVEDYMAVTPSRASQSCSHRPDRQLHGTTDFTAVVRGIPVGLAYRDAPADALNQAVDAAVMFTHPTELGSEGPRAIAAAVAWIMRCDPATATPEALLAHLLEVTQSPDMSAKLQLLQQQLPELQGLGHISDWAEFYRSAHWAHFTGVANRLWKQNLAIQGTQAAALALWVALVSWKYPKQAVMLAASLGGYAGITGALVGALVGALHGCGWVPGEWWNQLQDEADEDVAGEGEKSVQAEESDDEAAAAAATNQGKQAAAARAAAAGTGRAAAAVDVEAEAGSAAGDDGGDDDGPWSELRVGRYAIVLLGHELAGMQPQDAPKLFG